MGAELGIGYGNGKAFLRKLNGFGISKTDLEAALIKVKAENLNTNAQN